MTNKILITGASGKIGRRLCTHFLGLGWHVVGTTSQPESAISLQAELADVNFTAIPLDLANPGAAINLIAQLKDQEPIQYLVNNARSRSNLTIAAGAWPSSEQWQVEFQIGVVAAQELIVALASTGQLKAVVNISSIYGSVAPNPALNPDGSLAPVHYGVVKAALNHLTRDMATRLAGSGIRVNAVSFGGVEGRVDDRFRARYAALCPQGKMVEEDQVSGPVAFLLSDAATAMTGAILPVDGGWTLW